MDKQKYNGWHNVDTWLLILWLNNSESTYNTIKDNKAHYLKMPKKQLVDEIIAISGCTDKINKSNVYIKEIKEEIKEL